MEIWTSLLVPGLFVAQCLFVVLLIGGALVYSYTRLQSRRRAWGDLAARTNLTLEAGNWFSPPRLAGNYRRRALVLNTFTRRTGRRSRTTYTRLAITVDNRANVFLAIDEENVFSRIGKALGREDVLTGDEEIDRRFHIKCQPETFAYRLVTSINLRAGLLQARALNLQVEGSEVRFVKQGAEQDAEYLLFLFDLLSDLADMVERA